MRQVAAEESNNLGARGGDCSTNLMKDEAAKSWGWQE